MAKFTTDYVNLIANNLRDRYKAGFPVLKELLQNADDAGAKSLAFGYHDGFGDHAQHELLQGPALWILNDGRFKAEDRQAIKSFGLNSKAGESGSIGKFGLGMKSVFHLCEAFFYAASDGSEKFHEILSPWFQDSGAHPKHTGWENVLSQDVQLLETLASSQQIVRDGSSWFMLWIPLRRRSHVPSIENEATAPIIDRFPGDEAGRDLDFFTEAGIDRRIGQILPLLRNLQHVLFSGTASLPAFDLRLDLAEDGRRLDHVSELTIAGSVNDGGPRNQRLRFMAVQTLRSGAEPFARLQSAAGWPKTNAIVAGGKRAPVPDKAQPEGAVMIAHADGRRGQLSVQWAVFLPTEQLGLRFEATIPDSFREYTITLHGQFFVDSGRRGIEGMERLAEGGEADRARHGKPSIQVEWNQAMASDVVLPLLLPAIAEYVRRERFSDDHIAMLTDAFRRCHMLTETGTGALFSSMFSPHLHKEYVWVRTIRRDGASWGLQPASSSRLRLLPRPIDSDRERPWRALPGISQLGNIVFVDLSAPRISPPIDHWNEEEVCHALDRLPASTLCSESALKYLLDFLSMHRQLALNTERVQAHLVVQIRNALRGCTLTELRSQTQLLRELFAFLPGELRFGLGTRTTDARGALPELLYRELLGAETRALLIPADLAPEGDPGRPSNPDIEAWLDCVGAIAAKKIEIARCLDAAEGLLQSLGAERERQASMVRRHPRIPLLRAIDVITGGEVARSLEELLAAQKDYQLFKVADPKDRFGLTALLKRCAPALPIIVLRPLTAFYVDSARLPGSPEVPGTNSAAAMFRCVGAQSTAPDLSEPEYREGLLNHVGGIDNLADELVRKGIRYLLHGDPRHFDSGDPLWKDPSGQNSPWVRLWRMLLEDSWNVLSVAASGPIPDKCLTTLDIRQVDQHSVTSRLKLQQNFDRVDPAEFTRDEVDLVLGGLDDENAWRRLPLHQDTQFGFGPIDGTCFLGSEPTLPAGFDTTKRFIVCSRDEAHFRAQIRFIPRWTLANAALEILGSNTCSRFWRVLMDMLSSLGSGALPIPWHEVAWLPLKTGDTIAPSSLLRLEGMDAEIGALSAACQFAYAGVSELDEEVRLHPHYASLLAIVPSGADALPALAQLMSNAGLSVGKHGADAELKPRDNLAVLGAIGSLPAWSLVEKAAGVTSVADVVRHLLPTIAMPLSLATAESVLAEMAERAEAVFPHAVVCAYLREWAGSAAGIELRSCLNGLRMPAADGQWRPATQLVHGVFGVAPEYLIDFEAGEILTGIIVSNAPSLEVIHSMSASAAITADADGELETGLDAWAGTALQGSIGPALGALIGLFGDRARSLAERAMAPIAFDDYVLKLGWRDPGYDSAAMRMRWMGGNPSPVRPFSLIRPVFREAAGAAVTAHSLTGAECTIPLEAGDAITTLLAGPLSWQGGYGVEIRLRPLSCLSVFDLERQKSIVQKTAESLLVELYNQQGANLTGLWSLFEDADQVELEVARSLILEGLPQLMRQLPSVRRHPLVADALTAVDKARHDIASSRRANSDVEARRERLSASLAELEHLVEHDLSVQHAILLAVRNKVAGYQYEPSSIPFEILQNADDAVSEFQSMQTAEGRAKFADEEIGRFVAVSSGQSLILVHWGRPINHTGRHAGYKADYAQDLERMLMLGASAKELGDNVTGRFGLGFKSVLLATDRPVVESGDLRFEIVAGCLPRRAPLSSAGKTVATRYRQGALRATVVELPVEGDPATLIRRFSALAGLCAVLSRGIRQITAGVQLCSWRPERFLEAAGTWCEIGQSRLPCKDAAVPATLLVLRCPKGDAVFRLDGMPVRFDQEAEYPAPAIWIHAPTRGTSAGGVVLNGDFDVDTGRGSLPQGKAALRNHALALEIADVLGPMLSELIEGCIEDWQCWSQRLHADQNISVPAFWAAFWSNILADRPDGDSSQDARVSAAFATRLFDSVSTLTGMVPNGLPGRLALFARIDKIGLAVRCERFAAVLPLLLNWPAFMSIYPIRTWCSQEVMQWLDTPAVAGREHGIIELDRDVVLSGLGSEMRLAAGDVGAIAAIIRAWPQGLLEVHGWRNELSKVKLLARDGNWRQAHYLYVPTGINDLLVQVLPAELLLSETYEVQGGDWQLLCHYLYARSLAPDELSVYLIGASSQEGRRAAIAWLADNLDQWAVWKAIQTRARRNDWLMELHPGHDLIAGYGPADQGLILARLGLAGIEDSAVDESVFRGSELDLHTIHAWWMAHRNVHLPVYERMLWPERVDRMRLNDDDTDRDAWMTLFCLGIFRRFGRVRDEQNRGFLDFLHTHGWWETISRVDPNSGAEKWMDILREYAETSLVLGSYERWMDSFASLYRVARWFDDYVHLFRTLHHRDINEARLLLTPASDSSLSGSEFEAATLHRTLRIGHNLVIRELLRAGVLRSGVADRMAFMPGHAVREFLLRMGYADIESSEELYELLLSEFGNSAAKASFGGDYDIPLILLALNPALRTEALEWVAAQHINTDWDEDEAA